MAEATFNEPGDFPTAMESTDVVEVVKEQLTENTGTHFLDSGSAYGRNWEENQENPPWEKPRIQVRSSYVVKNVYHHLTENLERDEETVALEAALYAYGRNGPGEGDAWLTVMEDFADFLEHASPGDFESLGMGPELAEIAYAATLDLDMSEPNMTTNTYNHEFGDLTQIIQFVQLGGPYGEIAFVQVHGGCDVRGGYTGPRVYRVWDSLLPMEFWFHCEDCGKDEAESVAFGTEFPEYHPDENELRCDECGGLVQA
jgi:hypothetical protein